MSHANVFCRTVQCNLHLQAGPFEDSNSSSAHCICSIGSALQTSAHLPQDAAAAEPTFTRSGCLLACNVSSSVDGAAYLPIIVPNFPRLLSFTCSNELHHKPASTVCHCHHTQDLTFINSWPDTKKCGKLQLCHDDTSIGNIPT